MSNNARHSVGPAREDEVPSTREMAKQEFGRRLLSIMQEKGWNQSELARQADMGRDNISCYVRGRSLPDPKSLKKISDALGIPPSELLPYGIIQSAESEIPAMEIRQLSGHPDKVLVRLNKMLDLRQAAAIFDIVNLRAVNYQPG